MLVVKMRLVITSYSIHYTKLYEGIGQTVDIRPPQQVLELIPGARAERQNSEVSLWMVRKDEVDKVWETALKVMRNNFV